MPEVFELTMDPARRPLDPRQQRPLDVELLDDRLDDPVGVGRAAASPLEAAGRDRASSASGVKNGSGFSARARWSPRGRGVGGDVEQERRHAGVGEVRRDLGAHDAGAQHGNRTDHQASVSPTGTRRV